jgi:hypothetical protein
MQVVFIDVATGSERVVPLPTGVGTPQGLHGSTAVRLRSAALPQRAWRFNYSGCGRAT